MEPTDPSGTSGDARRLERQANEVERALDLLDEAAGRLREAGLVDSEFTADIDEALERLEDDVLTALPDPFVVRDAAADQRHGGRGSAPDDTRGAAGGAQGRQEGIHRERDQDELT